MIEAGVTPLKDAVSPWSERSVLLPEACDFDSKQTFFPYEEWVPAIRGIVNAVTYGKQKIAISNGFLSVGCHQEGIRRTSDTVGLANRNCLPRARVGLSVNEGNLVARLKSIKVYAPELGGVATLGFQSPSERVPHPATAVIDVNSRPYTDTPHVHIVGRSSDDELVDEARNVGLEIGFRLAQQLHQTYPGFDLFNKLEIEEFESMRVR